MEQTIVPAEVAYWNPAGGRVSGAIFASDCGKLEEKFKLYVQNPNLPRRNRWLLCLPILFEIILLILFPQIFGALGNSEDGEGLFFLIVPVLPLVYYIHKIHKLQRDLIKMMIAREHNWIYAPEESPSHWSVFAMSFPELFQKGNERQNMQDEFWGDFKSEKQSTPFYSGLFEYTVVIGSGRRRRSQTFQRTVFSFKLNKLIHADFRLEPEGIMNSFLNFFRSKEINTESAEFNKAFAVFYGGQKVDSELEIVKTLSPAVQVRLLELKKQRGAFTILFRKDTVMVVFGGNLFKKMHTNFFKKVAIDPRDEEAMSGTMNTILSISTEIVPYLD